MYLLNRSMNKPVLAFSQRNRNYRYMDKSRRAVWLFFYHGKISLSVAIQLNGKIVLGQRTSVSCPTAQQTRCLWSLHFLCFFFPKTESNAVQEPVLPAWIEISGENNEVWSWFIIQTVCYIFLNLKKIASYVTIKCII